MCGLFGWSWEEGNKPEFTTRVKLALMLGVPAERRGSQAWGYWDGGARKRKLGGLTKAIDAEFCAQSLMMGHTRQATHGDNIIKNAHPFIEGKYVGMHNGVISNHEELNKKYDRKFLVDSRHIFAHLNEKKSLKELKGYAAISFVHLDNPKKVYLCRPTSSGSLRVGEVKCRRTKATGIIWGSVRGWLEDAAAAALLDFTPFAESGVGEVWMVENGQLYSVPQLSLKIESSYSYDSRTGYGDTNFYNGSYSEHDEEAVDAKSFSGGSISSAAERAKQLEELWLAHRPEIYNEALEMLMQDELAHYMAVMNNAVPPDGDFLDLCTTLVEFRKAMLTEKPFTGFKAKKVRELDKTNWPMCKAATCHVKIPPHPKKDMCKPCFKKGARRYTDPLPSITTTPSGNGIVSNNGTVEAGGKRGEYSYRTDSGPGIQSKCSGVGHNVRLCSVYTAHPSGKCAGCREEIDTGWRETYASYLNDEIRKHYYTTFNSTWTKRVFWERVKGGGEKLKAIEFSHVEAKKYDEEFWAAKEKATKPPSAIIKHDDGAAQSSAEVIAATRRGVGLEP